MRKQREAKFYATLFFSVFRLSAVTFGGGYVIVPLMKKRFVEDLQWITEEEMLDFTAMAQAAPGPVAVNCAVLLGSHLAGLPGALLALSGTVLPPLITLSVISLFYTAFRENALVNAVLRGMRAGVAAVIADVVIGMGGRFVKGRDVVSCAVMAAAFFAVFFLQVNVVWVLAAAAALGIGRACWSGKRGKAE